MCVLFLHSLWEMVPSATWSLRCKTDKCINCHFINLISLCPPAPSGGLLQRSHQSLRPHLKLARLRHVFDAFEGFVLLSVHVQPVYLQP